MPGILFRPRREMIRPGYEAETGLLLLWAGLSCLLSSGDWYVGELLELQQGCEGPLEVPEVRCD